MVGQGQLEYSVDFSSAPVTGSIENFVRDFDNPFAAVGMAGLLAAQSGGQPYEIEPDLSETGPRAEDIDTPVGAGRVVVDLLRSIQHAQKIGALMEMSEAKDDSVATTLFTPLASPLSQQWGEILGSKRYGRSVQSIAIEYTQRPGHEYLAIPSAINMSAALDESRPGSQVSILFTNISSKRIVKGTDPDWRRLTVSAGQLDHYTLRRPDLPPSFHHVRRWAQGLQSVIRWHGDGAQKTN